MPKIVSDSQSETAPKTDERIVYEVVPVRIVWHDHFTFTESGWASFDDFEDIVNDNPDGLEVTTVGYLVKETEKCYYVISTFHDDKYTQGFCIIKSTVKEIDYLG